MKKILIIVLLNFSIFAIAQESAFIISNKQVVWQRIYESTKSIKEVKNILSSTGKIKFTGEDANTLTGEVSDFIMDFKGAGYTKMGTPMYLSNSSKFSGNFKIEFKEGRYRAMVTNINSKDDKTTLYYGGISIGDNGENTLEEFALTNDREYFKGVFEGRASKIINFSFTQLFDVSKYTKTDDNW
ncbi:hypothetical protein [Chryseobacterium gallinarum]|uniref:DUF4251 domain-containing protein n=1 Tax=Chryseobacterium gallinarum TaxID=1324352 RepID=A0ABX6KUQ0_CHRGL|nr:hypothetical protein [Chryseobacterium gallinarum]QIY92255.1 hypothetical protein FOB44_16990 [Chryseobacterium gallinarum]